MSHTLKRVRFSSYQVTHTETIVPRVKTTEASAEPSFNLTGIRYFNCEALPDFLNVCIQSNGSADGGMRDLSGVVRGRTKKKKNNKKIINFTISQLLLFPFVWKYAFWGPASQTRLQSPVQRSSHQLNQQVLANNSPD